MVPGTIYERLDSKVVIMFKMKCEALVPLFIAYLVCHAVLADESNCNKGVIETARQYVLENESITLTCVQYDVPALNLTFKQGSQIVQDNYIRELNESAIRMELPPLTSEYLNSIGVSLNFLCMDVELYSCIRSIHIDVDYYPIVPSNITCRVFNWEKTICSWSLGVKYKYPSNIIVTAEYMLDNSFERHTGIEQLGLSWMKCPKLINNTICVWEGDNFQRKWRMFLRLTVENKERNISVNTQNMSFIIDEINEPAAVEPKRIRITVINETCAKVRWRPYSCARNLVFNFTYSSPCTKSQTLEVIHKCKRKKRPLRKYVTVTVCDLKPHSNYTFSIAGKYRPKHKAIGHWSKTAHKNYTTADKAPDKSPEAIEGLYDHIFQTDRNFTIYWKPIDPCEVNSDMLKYTVYSNVAAETVDHPSFSTQLMPEALPMNVTIVAWNQIGDAPSVGFMTVFPDNMAPTPSELIVTKKVLNGQIGVVLTINLAKQENADIRAVSHILVSCKRQYSCLEHVHWEFINELELFRPVKDFTQFGLITKGYLKDQPVNTGIIWEKCSYEAGQRPGKPVLKEVDKDSQPDDGFRVDWLPLDCSKDHTGYIEYYQIAYCELQSNNSCPAGWVWVNVSKEETSYTNTDLNPGSQYRIKLKAVGIQGLSSESDPVVVEVDSPAFNRWIYGVIGFAWVVVIIVIFVVGIRCMRWKKNLERSQVVDCEFLKGLDSPLDKLIQEQAVPGDKYSSSSSDVSKNKSTDSGTSSLSSNGTEDSQVSELLLTNCDSDSVLNMNTSHHEEKPFKSQPDRNWINDVSMTGPRDKLPMYDQGVEMSGGTFSVDNIYGEVISDFDEYDKYTVTEFGKNEEDHVEAEEVREEVKVKEEDSICVNDLDSAQLCEVVEPDTQNTEVNKHTYATSEKHNDDGFVSESQNIPSHDSGICNMVKTRCDLSEIISEESNEIEGGGRTFDTSSVQTCASSLSDQLAGYGNGLDIELDSSDSGETIDSDSDVEEPQSDRTGLCDKDNGSVLEDTKHSMKHESDTSIHTPMRNSSDVNGTEENDTVLKHKRGKVNEVTKCRNGSRVRDPEHSSGDYQMVTMDTSSTGGSTCNSLNDEQILSAQNTI